MRPRHILISLLILLLVGLQASTFVTGTKVWPFMAYCMYSHCYGAQDIQAGKSTLYAVSAFGEAFEVNEKTVGLAFHAWKERFYQPLKRREPRAAQRLAERLAAGGRAPIVSFRLETRLYTITDRGIVEETRIQTIPVGD
ncbi:MAG: hypothetical protein JSV78_11195 [Phycisphaerales bacterium]|nr:MAG: hypothetical protein JSV78_11195 [Phycisphaerales bacterium]